MKRIILLRHGEAESIGSSGGTDKERKLTPRGIRQISIIGNRMKEADITPDYLVCSDAARAEMSAKIILSVLELDLDIHMLPELYGADPQTYVRLLKNIPDIYSSVMIVAHNPGIEEFASLLTGKRIGMGTGEMFEKKLKVTTWTDFRL